MTKTNTLRSFDELADAMRGGSVGTEHAADPVAEEITQHLAARAEKPATRVFQAPPNKHVAGLLRDEQLREAHAEDVTKISTLIKDFAEFFDAEIDGFFTDRLCTNLIKMAHDRASWISANHIPQVVDEMSTLRRGPSGEIDSVRLESKINYLARLEREVELWTMVSTSAKAAYKAISGKDYIEQPRGKNVSRKDAASAQLDAVLAKYGRA